MLYKAKNKLKIIIPGLILVILFFIFNKSLSSLSINTLAPIISIYNNVRERVFAGAKIFEPNSTLIAENTFLKEEVSRLQEQNYNLKMIESENKIVLESSLGSGFVRAMPISFPPQTPYDTLIIDKGEKDGIQINSKVFLGERVVLGEVESVYADKSRVKLFSSSGMKTETILERTGEVALLEGAGGGAFKLQLPIGFDIQEGDLFVLPGLPRTLVAEAVSIKTNPSSFISILLKVPTKISGNSSLYVQNH